MTAGETGPSGHPVSGQFVWSGGKVGQEVAPSDCAAGRTPATARSRYSPRRAGRPPIALCTLRSPCFARCLLAPSTSPEPPLGWDRLP